MRDDSRTWRPKPGGAQYKIVHKFVQHGALTYFCPRTNSSYNMLKTSFFIAFGLALFAACSAPTTPPPTPTPAPPSPNVVGGDQDAHGCRGSAGYQWSDLRQECIRLFETGIRLDPQAGQDATVSAFAVFKSPDMAGNAELFLPGQPNAILLQRAPDNGAGTWTSTAYTLKQWKGMLSVEDKAGKLLYQGALGK